MSKMRRKMKSSERSSAKDKRIGRKRIPRIYSNPGPTDLGRQLGELKRIQVVKTKIPNPRRPT
jgi:hypothetical protein